MKSARSLFLALFVVASVSSPVTWAGEPNTDALSGQSKSDKSKKMPGSDCSAEMGQEVTGPDATTLLE